LGRQGAIDDILDGYAAAATPELIARFDALSPQDIYAPVLDFLPTAPMKMADIGAGTGRDAAWFAEQGHEVLAIEPVAPLREAGMRLHRCSRITWLDDRLLALARARMHGSFDFITLCAVWQHIEDDARQCAMTSLGLMTAPGGMVLMSLRHGPGAPDRRVFSVSADETIQTAKRAGFDLVGRAESASVQEGNRVNGVRWTWVALKKTR
jgi:SAM-dependent methyltransferase